jgi:hypothetical protein
MAYSPFDVSALPELGGMDSINLEEELKKISEKITGLEDVELDGIKVGAVVSKEGTKHTGEADENSVQDDSILELSLDSIIATHEHVTIEHESDGSATVVSAARGKKRVRISDAATVYSEGSGLATTPTKGSDAAAGEEIDTAEAKSAKRRRIAERPSAETWTGAGDGSAAEEGSGEDTSWTWGDAAEGEGDELELSWSWGEGESETETDISHHQDSFATEADRRRSALMAEVFLSSAPSCLYADR